MESKLEYDPITFGVLEFVWAGFIYEKLSISSNGESLLLLNIEEGWNFDIDEAGFNLNDY